MLPALVLTKFHYPKRKLFVWQAFMPKEKRCFATGQMISTMEIFKNSIIVVPESQSSMQFPSVCLCVSYANSYQITLPYVEGFFSGRLLKEPYLSHSANSLMNLNGIPSKEAAGYLLRAGQPY